ncbi:MAG: hypothetical protein OIN88_10240 [Candidatus Methanoperedens sp.]|nr:hypothetical protein [Candidatus Methanoperedens sp.]MCZ7360563.1 hypothetical protein [Candidatus Methanoperedens sp.]HLB69535.1 hypothetical protein [Candidatus Methanoperedens sp.]
MIDVRKRCREVIKLIDSKPCHPEGGLPCGVPRGITEEERRWIKKTADYCVEFAQFALMLLRNTFPNKTAPVLRQL